MKSSTKILITPIRMWQKYYSSSTAPRCKYFPSCSQYMIDAITEYGLKGVLMGVWRIIRCNPWSHGGVDYAGGKRIEYKNLKGAHQ